MFFFGFVFARSSFSSSLSLSLTLSLSRALSLYRFLLCSAFDDLTLYAGSSEGTFQHPSVSFIPLSIILCHFSLFLALSLSVCIVCGLCLDSSVLLQAYALFCWRVAHTATREVAANTIDSDPFLLVFSYAIATSTPSRPSHQYPHRSGTLAFEKLKSSRFGSSSCMSGRDIERAGKQNKRRCEEAHAGCSRWVSAQHERSHLVSGSPVGPGAIRLRVDLKLRRRLDAGSSRRRSSSRARLAPDA